MKFLIDQSPDRIAERKQRFRLIQGQLQTKTAYRTYEGDFGIDNNAFSGFDPKDFRKVIDRNVKHRRRCLFVAVPDVVADARRTLEVWHYREDFVPGLWRRALVLQDGIGELSIPWSELQAVFVGGSDRFKDSPEAWNCVRVAKMLRKHVHVGRVNTIARYRAYADLGADTCDGTGVAIFPDKMLTAIEHELERPDHPNLFEHQNSEDDERQKES